MTDALHVIDAGSRPTPIAAHEGTLASLLHRLEQRFSKHAMYCIVHDREIYQEPVLIDAKVAELICLVPLALSDPVTSPRRHCGFVEAASRTERCVKVRG